MLESDRAAALAGRELADGYVRPDYGGYCFANVPAAAAGVVGADLGPGLPADALPADVLHDDALPDGTLAGAPEADVSHVVVLFVDALGWRQFERVRGDVPLLSSFEEAGAVTPLTTTFPSETAACVTTMHTATDPVEHGLLGWNAYDPDADAVYETLPFAAGDGGDLALDAADLFDGEPVYPALASAGVDPHVVEPDHGPGYRDAALRGATTQFYEEAGEFGPTLAATLAAADAPSYTYAYTPVVDATAHEHGPADGEHDDAVARTCAGVREALASLDGALAAGTLVCLVADHGQVDVAGKARSLDATGVTDHLRTDRAGNPLVLGGPRNVHLHTTDRAAARDCLADLDALVLSREEALAEDLWGRGEPGPAFERNCGDLLVVPDEGMLFPSRADPEFELAGMHGGLHPGEALVPFGAARASDLV